jgi:glutamate racemase
MRTQAIALFDSGIGGLSVYKHIRELMPYENMMYFADSAHAPYGNKPPAEILARCDAITDFLVQQNAKCIVVACNTATAAAVAHLRAKYSLPIIAIEPAIKPGVAMTSSGVIGVLATAYTLTSEKYLRLVKQYEQQATILAQACHGWVELVEQGETDSKKSHDLVAAYVEPLLASNADTLLLGCTHYPFLRHLIEEASENKVHIIDPSLAVAKQVQRRLQQANLETMSKMPGENILWSNGDIRFLADIAAKLMGHAFTVESTRI